MEPKRAQPQAADVRRAQIIQATLDIVGEKGLDALTTAEIARRVGVAEATVFKHFRSKIDILREATGAFRTRLLGMAQAIAQAEIPATAKLEDLLRLQLGLLERNAGVPRLVFGEHLHLKDGIVRENIRECLAGFRLVLMAILSQGVREGNYRDDIDYDMAATCYIGLVQTTVFRWILDGGRLLLETEAGRMAAFLNWCFSRRGAGERGRNDGEEADA